MKSKGSNYSSKVKRSCRNECNKGKKTMPIIMKKLGEKVGLGKEEVDQKIKDYNEKCESNCIHLMEDKDLVKDIIKKVQKKRKGVIKTQKKGKKPKSKSKYSTKGKSTKKKSKNRKSKQKKSKKRKAKTRT